MLSGKTGEGRAGDGGGGWVSISLIWKCFYLELQLFILKFLFMSANKQKQLESTISDLCFLSGVGIRPLNRDSRIDSNLFKLQLIDDNQVLTDADGEGDLNIDYAKRAEKFLEVYKSEVNTSLGYNEFNLASELGECGTHPYGYLNGDSPIKPCIFLKFNKIWGWNPKPITDEDFEKNDWPASFKQHFDPLSEDEKNQVFVDCQGRYPADKEALNEGMTYIPATQGFPVKYFPYKGDKENYHSPLVVVQFDTSKMARFVGQLIHVECRAYYKGVVHTTKTKTGMVQFEILLEEKLSLD